VYHRTNLCFHVHLSNYRSIYLFLCQHGLVLVWAERELVEDMVQLVGPVPEAVLAESYGLDRTACTLYASLKQKQPVAWAKRFPSAPAPGTSERERRRQGRSS
jgi:hypothetical protein